MKTRLKPNWLFLTMLSLLALLPAARAYYDPSPQRWLTRDPIQEQPGKFNTRGLRLQAKAGWNLYQFVFNQAINRLDTDGRLTMGDVTHAISEATRYIGFGGMCCNNSSSTTWYVDNDVWNKLKPGECTGFTTDCDGIMCGGQFYPVSWGHSGGCDQNNCPFAPMDPPMTIPNDRAHTPPPEDPPPLVPRGTPPLSTPPVWNF